MTDKKHGKKNLRQGILVVGVLASLIIGLRPVMADETLPTEICEFLLQTAYAPGMARFNSCESTRINNHDRMFKVIIRLQGGILGTPYVIKGYVNINDAGDYVETDWKDWDSPLRPISTRIHFESERQKWDF